jgi:16S rRNA (guanine966-N2)-methyltransferase
MLGTLNAEVLNLDARIYLESSTARPFDIVFLDPPFTADLHDELCRLLSEQGWLAADARVYIEMDRDQPAICLPKSWQVLKNKTAGNVRYMLASIEV